MSSAGYSRHSPCCFKDRPPQPEYYATQHTQSADQPWCSLLRWAQAMPPMSPTHLSTTPWFSKGLDTIPPNPHMHAACFPPNPVHSSRTRLAHPASHSLQQVLSHQLLLDRDSLTANPLHTLCLWPLAHQQSHCLRLGMGQLSQHTFGPVHRHRALPEATDLLSLHPSCL